MNEQDKVEESINWIEQNETIQFFMLIELLLKQNEILESIDKELTCLRDDVENIRSKL